MEVIENGRKKNKKESKKVNGLVTFILLLIFAENRMNDMLEPLKKVPPKTTELISNIEISLASLFIANFLLES